MDEITDKPADLKIILLGDSAVGKSKLVERFLLNNYIPKQLSTYALTLYRHTCKNPLNPAKDIDVEIWDTAGQERFFNIHPSYYHNSHCCILCFDISRKITYKNLDRWYNELLQFRGKSLPVLIIANKIDLDPSRATKVYAFIEKRRKERDDDLPVYFASASDGTNVVGAFVEAIKRGMEYKEKESFGEDEIFKFIEEETNREDGMFRNIDVDEKEISDAAIKRDLIDGKPNRMLIEKIPLTS